MLNVLAAYLAKYCKATTVSYRERESHSYESISSSKADVEQEDLKRPRSANEIHREVILTWVEANPP